ncbi:TPA: hypothetical protein ACF3EY_002597, partial [Enterococcus faecium]
KNRLDSTKKSTHNRLTFDLPQTLGRVRVNAPFDRFLALGSYFWVVVRRKRLAKNMPRHHENHKIKPP